MVTLGILQAIVPTTPADRLELFVDPLNHVIEEFEVRRVQEFISQWAHETQGFMKLEENLNYSAERLPQVWSRFADNPQDPPALRRPNDLARRVAHNPQALGGYIYANRMGNGAESTGEGWTYRGRGLPHLTGKSNYAACGLALDLPLLADPDLLLKPMPATRAAGWFWKTNGCEAILDFAELTKKINGGTTGLQERYAYLGRAKLAFADPDVTQPQATA